MLNDSNDISRTIKAMFICLIFLVCLQSEAKDIGIDAEDIESIAHYRAVPVSILDMSENGYVQRAIGDHQGYIWRSSDRGLERSDGYELTLFQPDSHGQHEETLTPYIFADRHNHIWSANHSLHKFDYAQNKLITVNLNVENSINSIVEDLQGNFWIADDGRGLVHYNPTTDQFIERHLGLESPVFPLQILSMVFEPTQNIIWISAKNGLFAFDVKQKTMREIATSLSSFFPSIYIRDMVIDTIRNELWVGTPLGLLQLNTKSLAYTVYIAEERNTGLPTSNISTVFIDSRNNVWAGTEKEGICLFKRSKRQFMCLRSQINGQDKLPFATIENITEDAAGSLWLSMNTYGLYRITPRLEKFRRLRDEVSTKMTEYFPHSFGAVISANNDLWIGTDGGGINIYNPNEKSFRNLQHNPLDPSTISSNSVISLSADPQGKIWAGTWAGGIFRIDPITQRVDHFVHDPNVPSDQTIIGNNVIALTADNQKGVWAGVWGIGLQYINPEKNEYKRYINPANGGTAKMQNAEITHLQIHDNKLFISGLRAFEYLDLDTKQFTQVLDAQGRTFNYFLIESDEEIWIASLKGLLKYNTVTSETITYTTKEGLADDRINYLYKDEYNRLWIATDKGISLLDTQTEVFTNYYKKDGLVSNVTSSYARFFRVDNDLYIPNKYGVNIIDIENLPVNDFVPQTRITTFDFLNIKAGKVQSAIKNALQFMSQGVEIDFSSNSIHVSFTALSYIYPEQNRFKYRLTGLQDDFTEIDASARFAKFNSLPSGVYTFEVFAMDSSGTWDSTGDAFNFVILPPWWQTWWARTLFIISLCLLIYGLFKWRLMQARANEKELGRKVEEKTQQLKEYASQLETTSQSVTRLNEELEQRVESRTAELQIEINEREVAQRKLFHLAFHDSLTGLPNREWLIKKLNTLIVQRQNNIQQKLHKPAFALMFLDGDRFKHINDTYGHTIGDELLIASAMRLSKLLGEGQSAARLGGDEFTVLIEEVSDQQSIEKLAIKVIEAFTLPFTFEKLIVHFNVSVGVLTCDGSYTTVTGVLRDADIAMYNAKQAGKGTYKIFDQKMREESLELSELENDLTSAIANNELHLVYQPLLNLKTNKVEGLEALIRWSHPTRGNIPPNIFIPIAEETGQIIAVGSWVLEKACAQMRQWQLFDCLECVTVSVNLSSNQLRGADFLKILDSILEKTGLQGKYLKLELTESTLIENNDTMKHLLDQCIARNIELAIDDFGTGYSSLAYLNQLPAQYLKIDRHFIDAIDNTPNGNVNNDALEIVKATVSLGQSLGMKIVAEGIESELQFNEVKRIGTDIAQGYYISKPLPANEVIPFIQPPLTFVSGQTASNPLQKYKDSINAKALRMKKGK